MKGRFRKGVNRWGVMVVVVIVVVVESQTWEVSKPKTMSVR